MTDKEKLLRIKKLADEMYRAAQYLTTDASHLHKVMDEYHQFIVHDYHKEEPVSEDLEDATNNYCVNVRKGYPRVMDETDRYIYNAFTAGAKWQKEHLMANAVETTFNVSLSSGLYDKLWIKGCKDGDKLLVIKKDEL